MPGRSGVEALSGLLDFNHAPFFQGFIEIRASKKRRCSFSMALLLRWRDLQRGGAVLSAAFNPRRSGRIHCADGPSLRRGVRPRSVGAGGAEPGLPGGDGVRFGLTGLHVQPHLAVGDTSARQALTLPWRRIRRCAQPLRPARGRYINPPGETRAPGVA
jgi:hypothetical protein